MTYLIPKPLKDKSYRRIHYLALRHIVYKHRYCIRTPNICKAKDGDYPMPAYQWAESHRLCLEPQRDLALWFQWHFPVGQRWQLCHRADTMWVQQAVGTQPDPLGSPGAPASPANRLDDSRGCVFEGVLQVVLQITEESPGTTFDHVKKASPIAGLHVWRWGTWKGEAEG